MRRNIVAFLPSFLLLILSASCMGASAKSVKPSLQMKEKVVKVRKSFNRVKANNIFNVEVGEGTPSVRLEGPSNMLQYVSVSFKDHMVLIDFSVLDLEIKGDCRITAYITCDELRSLRISGAGSAVITSDMSSYGDMEVLTSGSGEIQCDHKLSAVETVTLDTQGSGVISVASVESKGLIGRSVGSADVVVGKFNGRFVALHSAGSGDVIVDKGSAKSAELYCSGSGTVNCKGVQCERGRAFASGTGEIYCNVRKILEIEKTGLGEVIYSGSPEIIR